MKYTLSKDDKNRATVCIKLRLLPEVIEALRKALKETYGHCTDKDLRYELKSMTQDGICNLLEQGDENEEAK